MKHRRQLQRSVGIFLAFFLSAGLILITGEIQPIHWLGSSTAFAQSRQTEGVWQQIYQKLPDLPLENQYVSKETGKVDSKDTLVGRLIRYHIYLKGRPPIYRLDWKLTLADYLGVNEPIEEAVYPSRAKLRNSPLSGDIAAVSRLSRAQREGLVQALVDAFTPEKPNATNLTPQPSVVAPKPSPSQSPEPAYGPGAAQLLQ